MPTAWNAGRNGQLVGGVYWVAVGGFFAGESMFHQVSNASKVALFHLIEHLRKQGFVLFDIQMLTPDYRATRRHHHSPGRIPASPGRGNGEASRFLARA